jgi:hypothetical protein
MPVQVNVFRTKLRQSAAAFRQIIVPLRFGRAVSGAPVGDAPDPDDRGFDLGSEGSWRTDIRGAVVGIPVGETARLKVFRNDIDAGAPIFITSTQERAVVTPTTAVPATGIFQVRVTGPILTSAKIQARLGAANGPVFGEMIVHTMSYTDVPVCCHFVTLNGTVLNIGTPPAAIPARTARHQGDVQPMFTNGVNAIWRPFGIRFNVVEWKETTCALTATGGSITDHYQGHVAVNNNTSNWYIQASELCTQSRRGHAVNVYFIRGTYNVDSNQLNRTRGIGTSVSDATHYGVVVPDPCDENDLAHELGHVLNLDFHGGGKIGHSDDTATTEHSRSHIWARRRLMYSYNPYGPLAGLPARRVDVGYGNYVRGSLLTAKNLTGDPTDNEYSEARTRATSALP